jgi:hypothetical protein
MIGGWIERPGKRMDRPHALRIEEIYTVGAAAQPFLARRASSGLQ